MQVQPRTFLLTQIGSTLFPFRGLHSVTPGAVVLHGVGGAGKSMLAAELLWQRLPYAHTAVWWRAAQLVDALFGSLGEEAKIRAHQDCNTELLVLNDLGHIVGDRSFDSLYNVIAARQEDDRATIVTLNEPLLAL